MPGTPSKGSVLKGAPTAATPSDKCGVKSTVADDTIIIVSCTLLKGHKGKHYDEIFSREFEWNLK